MTAMETISKYRQEKFIGDWYLNLYFKFVLGRTFFKIRPIYNE